MRGKRCQNTRQTLTLASRSAKSINVSIGNGRFETKREAYRQSKFLLTKSLGEQVVVGVNTAVNRAVEELETFEAWSSQTIERRQHMLLRLAQQVWDMPAVELAPASSLLEQWEQGA